MREAGAGDAAVVDAARAALLETTDELTVGPVTGIEEPVEGVLDVHFATGMPGYPGWSWSVGVSTIDGANAPSVLEVSLVPGEGALTAPEWVPWSDRLADYRAAQDAKAAHGGSDEDDVDDDDLDDDDDELDDVDDLDEEDLLSNGDDDLDGVDFEGSDDADDPGQNDPGQNAPAESLGAHR
ncbi:MAG: hypothetical protein JWP66_1935 [Naasia sp.]|nr:hypothetical protein [Naasia sp.]